MEASTGAPEATPLRLNTPDHFIVARHHDSTAHSSVVHHQLAGCKHTSGDYRHQQAKRTNGESTASNHIKQHEPKPLLETMWANQKPDKHSMQQQKLMIMQALPIRSRMKCAAQISPEPTARSHQTSLLCEMPSRYPA